MKFLQVCVEQCEFQKFKKSKFYCDLYERILAHVKIHDCGIKIIRCRQCIDEQTEYEILKDSKIEH